MKKCPACGETKPLESFPRDRTSASGRRSRCSPCNNAAQRARFERDRDGRRAYYRRRYAADPEPAKAYSRARYRADPERHRHLNYLRNYGLSAAAVDALKAAQGHRCMLCDREAPLVVDHDHTSGAVRGMLCHKCNLLLGAIEKLGLERVTRYLLAERD